MHPDVIEALSYDTDIVLARDVRHAGLSEELRRAAETKQLTRVWWGAYVASDRWALFSQDEQYRMRVQAVHLTRKAPVVFSHLSAAAAWGLPLVGSWPSEVHVIGRTATGGRTSNGVVRHPGLERAEVTTTDGVAVTSVAETVIAVATVLGFAAAVAMADFALHTSRGGTALCTQRDLLGALATRYGHKGYAAAARVVAFADGQSDSPGESVSRANMQLCGFELPELQVTFRDSFGLAGIVDFFWRSIRRIGEFDGLGKYLREEYARGRNPAEVVIAEKKREDRLRALGPSVSRWDWRIAASPRALGTLLKAAGVPRAT